MNISYTQIGDVIKSTTLKLIRPQFSLVKINTGQVSSWKKISGVSLV